LLDQGVGHTFWAKSTDQINSHKATCQLKDKQTNRKTHTELPSGKNPPLMMAHVAHAPPQNSPTTGFHQHPPISTNHSLKEQSMVIHAQSHVKKPRRVVTMCRTPHLNTAVASRSQTRRHQRTQLEGSCQVEDGGKAQIGPSKNVENEEHGQTPPLTRRDGLSPSSTS
jgi:hypothetical protein